MAGFYKGDKVASVVKADNGLWAYEGSVVVVAAGDEWHEYHVRWPEGGPVFARTIIAAAQADPRGWCRRHNRAKASMPFSALSREAFA
jgi:hypothetical protein